MHARTANHTALGRGSLLSSRACCPVATPPARPPRVLLVSCARLGDGLRVALARGVWFVVCVVRGVCASCGSTPGALAARTRVAEALGAPTSVPERESSKS